MKLTIFTYERNLDLPHEIQYIDRQMIKDQGLQSVVDQINKFEPDLIIEREFNDGIAKYADVYKELKFPKAYWCIDAHITLAEHINYSKHFNYVFLAQSWFQGLFEDHLRGKCYFLPLCHTQTLAEYGKTLLQKPERDIPMSFVGNIRSLHPEREEYVMFLKEVYGDDFLAVQADYDKTLDILRRSKATFNCSLNNDLNFRVWEALAMGTPILTDQVTDLNAIDGLKDVVMSYDKLYPDFYGLENPIKRETTQFIRSKHTLTHRYLQLIEMVQKGNQYAY